MAVTFGALTTSNYVPRAMRTNNDAGIGMINQLNCIHNAGSPEQGGGGGPKLTADVANDYAGIRAGMEQPQGRGIIGKIADFIVGNKIAHAQGQ